MHASSGGWDSQLPASARIPEPLHTRRAYSRWVIHYVSPPSLIPAAPCQLLLNYGLTAPIPAVAASHVLSTLSKMSSKEITAATITVSMWGTHIAFL